MNGKVLKTLKILLPAAAICLALFAFVGCNIAVDSPERSDQYALFDDGCGKQYTLFGGQNVTVYYAYDPTVVLKFTRSRVNAATGEIDYYDGDAFELDCGDPHITTMSLNVLTDGEYVDCDLTVIVSPQAVTSVVSVERSAFDWVYEGVGSMFVFMPERSGKYSFSCEQRNGDGEARLYISEMNGMPHEPTDIYYDSRVYYVHVGVVGSQGGYDGVTVTAEYAFEEVKLGETDIIVDEFTDLVFTPDADGFYTFYDSLNSLMQIVDELGNEITPSGTVVDAMLDGGTTYSIRYTVGYATAWHSMFTVAMNEKTITADEPNKLGASKYYAFEISRCARYEFSASTNYKYGATYLNVYCDDGTHVDRKCFVDGAEFFLKLDAGKYWLCADNAAELTFEFAPQRFESNMQWLTAGETFVFVPVFGCEYGFRTDGGDVKIFDAEWNDVTDTALVAGADYYIVADMTGTAYAVPIVRELASGVTATVDGTETFKVGVDVGGRYKFDGASAAELYTQRFEQVAGSTFGAVAQLTGGYEYYATVAAYGKVSLKLYPAAIPADGMSGVRAANNGYLRFELDAADAVSIITDGKSTAVTLILCDSELTEIKRAEDAALDAELAAGTYYVKVEYSGAAPYVRFASVPEHIVPTAVESGVRYSTAATTVPATYEYDCDGGTLAVTTVTYTVDAVRAYYVRDNNTHVYLRVDTATDHLGRTTYTFRVPAGVELCYIEVRTNTEFIVNA